MLIRIGPNVNNIYLERRWGNTIPKAKGETWLLGAKAGDVIWYFKTDDKKSGVSTNPQEISL